MTVEALITKVKQSEILSFAEVIEAIDANYSFTPSFFKNGDVVNEENQNNGSCKVFSFAKMHKLSEKENLFLFGEHYQKVLEKTSDADNKKISSFMNFGWNGIAFEKEALS